MVKQQPRHGIDREALRYLVFAGNMREYYQWCSDQGIPGNTALYVSNTSTLMGMKGADDDGIEFAIVGTFQQRQDAEELIDTATTRFGNRKVITSS
jgi:hypothetical protein